MADTGTVEKTEDFGPGGEAKVGRWLREIEAYDKEFGSWQTRVRAIVKRYRDEREISAFGATGSKLNILWSNIKTLQPAHYSKRPDPRVGRRFRDKDQIGAAASVILERAMESCLDAYDFDYAAKRARDDYLLSARGQLWVRYVPYFGDETRDRIPLEENVVVENMFLPNTVEYRDGDNQIYEGARVQNDENGFFSETDPYRPVLDEQAEIDFIPWENFGHTPAPTWDKVRAVWKCEYLTRKQLVERFGAKIGNEVKLTLTAKGVEDDKAKAFGDVFMRAEVYEIWDSVDRKAIWISKGYSQGPLDEQNDPLELEKFFPCPRPAFATTTGDTLVPVPDFAEYQDQANQIDELTRRIDLLTRAVKMAGAYDGSYPDLEQIVHGEDNKLIPVNQWGAFAEKGGLIGAISWLPIKEVAEVLANLIQVREQLKRDLYEISGLSDIVRGQSTDRGKATATEQRIKGQFASMRLRDSQDEFNRFLRDTYRIKAEIICEQFSEATLAEASGWEQSTMARMIDEQAAQQGQQGLDSKAVFAQAVELLKNDKLRSFRIDIETDETVFQDEEQEKKNRVEFLSALSGFLEQAIPAAQQYPALAKPLAESMFFGIRGFRAGRQLETAWEDAIEEMQTAQPQQGEQEGNQQGMDPMEARFKQAEMAQGARATQGEQALEGQRIELQAVEGERDYEMQQQDQANKQAELQIKLITALSQLIEKLEGGEDKEAA